MSTTPSVPPREPDALGRLLRSIGGRDWLAAAVAGLGAWVAAYVVAGLSLLLTVAVLAVGGSDSSFGGGSLPDTGSATPAPDPQALLSGISVLLGAPAQLVALADFGRLHLSGSVPLFGIAGSASLGVVPALVLAAQVVIAVVLTRRIRTRTAGLPQLVVTSVLTGLVLTACTTLAALVLAIRFPATSGVSIGAVHAVGIGSVLGAFAVGALSAFLARPSALTGGRVLAGRLLGTVRVAVGQVAVVVALVVVALLVIAFVVQPSWGSALPLVLGNLALAIASIGFLGGIGVAGFGSGAQTASVFGSSGWLWLVVLLVVVTAVAAGFALAVRRNDRARTTLDWVVSPLAWLLVGLVVFVLGTGVFSYSATGSSTVGGAGSMGVAPWTPVVFAAWGAAIEAVARYLAPVVLPRVAPRVLIVTSRFVGADPQPAASGWPVPGAVGPVPGAAGPVPGPAGPASGVAGPVSGAAAPVSDAAEQPAAGTVDQPTTGVPASWSSVDGVVPDGTPHGTAPSAGSTGPFVGPGATAPFIGAGAATPAAPMSPRAKKVLVRSLVAGGAVVVVLIAGAVTAGVLRTNVWGPAPTVRSYVDAIAHGDAGTADRMSEVSGAARMLDAAVLKSATDRPTDVRVGRVTTTGDRAVATVSYRQGGKNRSGQVELRRTGTTWLVHDEWRVTTPLAQEVSITAADTLEGAPVSVGGERVGKIEDGTFRSMAYPGTYRVEVGGTKYFTGGTKTVAVGGSASPYVDFAPKATDQLTKDAEAFVTDQITTCAAKTDVDALSGCPWYGPYDADGPVHYQVTTMPKLAVEASGSGSIRVTSTSDGVIGYDYTSFFGDSGHQEDTFDVHEYLEVRDGKLVSAY
ncbi:hypothetical protein [Curtobacterium sp. 9128]|uniref:hypothetical protein n=1 Tax=Curtobacterium sp. 9128 TaxID=1793722 RepID=UPI00119FA8C9|nr:hypothetical protein [Curtobacterium sp. 9128]